MAPVLNIVPGAPGIYRYPNTPLRELTGVRMDVCAFVGVAPRGPAREPVLDQITRNCRPDPRVIRQLKRTVPVPVESFDEYRRLYGGFEGPGLLPHAVALFFEQGGRRAYIARIVHRYATPAENDGRVAMGTVGGVMTGAGPLILRARNEGSWGNHLSASISFRSTALRAASVSLTSVAVTTPEPLTAGTLLRLKFTDGSSVFRFLSDVTAKGRMDTSGKLWEGTLETAVSELPALDVEVLEADLTLTDGDGRSEVHQRLGLSPSHPSWIGAALCYDSELVYPQDLWLSAQVLPDPAAPAVPFTGGIDAYDEIVPDDFFDGSWTLGDDEPGDGITSLTNLSDLSLLVVPDLYSPAPLLPVKPVADADPIASPRFERCVDFVPTSDEQGLPIPGLDGLRLDPLTDLDAIRQLQARLAEFSSEAKSWILLLDVPPGLTQRQILKWRAAFDSTSFDGAYVAAYHPWLNGVQEQAGETKLIRLPPSAVAAGIIAEREIAVGITHGPANVLAAQVVDVVDAVSPARHDELHPEGINVYLRERDGIRLTAARTLSRDPAWRQLNVRRLVTLIRRTLEQQTQWMVFEPNNEGLRSEIRKLLGLFLGDLFRAGAFRGTTEEESFFVQCDAELNPPSVVDAGKVIALIGIAPSEPLEFIVLRLSREGDGTLTLEP